MPVYGIIGTTDQIFCKSSRAKACYVLMQGERPSPSAVAQADGSWLVPQRDPEVQAKEVRDSTVNANIAVHGVEWQVGREDRDNIRNAIETAEHLKLPEEQTQKWILADNTQRETTTAELRQILTAYSLRMQKVYDQYMVWRDGDKKAPFAASL